MEKEKITEENTDYPDKRSNYYEKALDEAQMMDSEGTTEVEGIDDEIMMLRVITRYLLETDPGNVRMIVTVTSTLGKLVKLQHSINKDQKKGMKEVIGGVIKEIAVPLGIAALKKKIQDGEK
jgi:hypothetical protein